MRTLGIDLASQPGNTGVAGIDWPETAPPRMIPFAELEGRPFTDACLVEILRYERWGRVAIDVPFGWPRDLLDLLGRWRAGEPVNLPMDERRGRSETLYRRTDLVTWDRTGV